MRALRLAALLALCGLALTGCRISGEVENQAYVLTLGVDRLPSGMLEVTVRVPRVGRSSVGDSGGEEEGGAYLTFSAAGGDWAEALEALQWATPRRINLSHIEMLVASQALASEPGFAELVGQIAETPHLYATARFAVCEGAARAFIDAGKTIIGTRMSSELQALLKHYVEQGYIPQCSLADAYYAWHSVCSDPVALWVRCEPEAQGGAPEAQTNDSFPVLESPTQQRYGGTALFRGGVLADVLPMKQTALLNLVRGDTRALALECDGRRIELTAEGRPRLRARVDGDAARLSLAVSLSTIDVGADLSRVEDKLREALAALVQRCQRLGCDPFGFADSAISQFWTVSDWLACGWPERYAHAALDVRVSVRRLFPDRGE